MVTIVHGPYATYVTRDVRERLSALDAHYTMGLFPPQYPVPSVLGALMYVHVLYDTTWLYYTNSVYTLERKDDDLASTAGDIEDSPSDRG